MRKLFTCLVLCVACSACALGTAAINKEHLTPCQLAQAGYSDALDGVTLAGIVGKGQREAAIARDIAAAAVQRQCGAPQDTVPVTPTA